MRSTVDRLRVAAAAAGLSMSALVVAKLSAERPTSAVKLVLIPVLVVAVLAPAVPVVLGVAFLPYQISIFGAGGLLISASDVLLSLGFGGVVLAAMSGTGFTGRRLSPIVPAVVLYFFAVTIVWANLPTVDGVVTIVQRLELIVAALVVGAFLAHQEMLDRALSLYVAAAGILAVAAVVVVFVLGQEPETYLGVQKNPAGQAIANALIIVIFNHRTAARVPMGLVLAVGLIAAQSRGAILATVIAMGIAAAIAASDRRLRSLAVIPIVAAVFYAGYSALPSAQQERLVRITPGGDVATETRENYADDAVVKIRSAPVLGTGLGLYESGDRLDQTYTIDPHNVLLLELAEGGIVLGGGFVVLSLSSAWVLVRRRLEHPIVIVALAVQVSTVIHGLVDVYWVRGTPVIGWLLVGAALHLAGRSEDDVEDESTSEVEPTAVSRPL